MGCCDGFARCVLVTFNILFVLTGVFVLGVGIFLKVNPNLLNIQHVIELNSGDKYISTAAYILIGFGIFVLLVGLFGFIGGCKQIKFFLALYMGCVVLVFLGEFSAGIIAAVYKGKVDDTLQTVLRESLSEYDSKNKTSELVNKGWDGIQSWLKCCGERNFTDYTVMKIPLADDKLVPDSCCGSNKQECQKEAKAKVKPFKNLYDQGCYDQMENQIKSHITLLIGAGVGVAMFQLLGLFLACAAWKKSDDDDLRV
ncbi:CD82 antigen [Mytilus galloprovincialis]|uniref:Tetraspanin n=1 Tax=Mytilus galloprovincialis TaxID=29158 RepID=A0A8B6ECI5_MYTGA|nr:CD82 antigen [Mytilus galloprovincialis]